MLKITNLVILAGMSQAQYRDINLDDELLEGVNYRAGNGQGQFRTDQKLTRITLCRIFYPNKKLAKCPYKTQDVDDILRNYGCNCHPVNFDTYGLDGQDALPTYNMGKNGRPLDALDRACTGLRDAYTCVVMDMEDGLFVHPDDNSDVSTDKCGRDTQFIFHINDNKEIICGPISNPEYVNGIDPQEECAFAVCSIERRFTEMAAIAIGPDRDTFLNENASKFNVFNQTDVCVSQNNGFGANSCCGTYPYRHPFVDFIKVCCPLASGFEPVFIGDCP